ncbi:hypothetical protein LX73_0830 [Fodinibius salinus]|uniref:Outer membrane protein beta-barrel domain-containing protein n=1 Tax=Fodinibius salinus TaxID=860790 RepID=A0A5D3YR88_9BACT|nr:hypothetical protein [Fodinibius salinus]TYP95523.1 hypothetical protein LX73_0830 [Fodinibius salinus]
MKKVLLIIFFCGTLLTIGHSAYAQNSGFGVGAIINSPTGISAKAWINEDFAIDGAFSFQVGTGISQTYLHVNALQHHQTNNQQLKFYYGLGSRFLWNDLTNDVTAGIRVPGGISYAINNTKLESFFEIAPTIDFTPITRFGFEGAVGLRIYLN